MSSLLFHKALKIVLLDLDPIYFFLETYTLTFDFFVLGVDFTITP